MATTLLITILIIIGLVFFYQKKDKDSQKNIAKTSTNQENKVQNQNTHLDKNTPPKIIERNPWDEENPIQQTQEKTKSDNKSALLLTTPIKKTDKEKEDIEKARLRAERSKNGGHTIKPLLNGTEKMAKRMIVSVIHQNNGFKKWDLLYQVSMGEFIYHPNNQMRWDINCKRVDFLLIDKYQYTPIAAIEIHGQGHYQGDTATYSDIVKRNAFKAAGIKYIPIPVGNINSESEEMVKKMITSELFGEN